jgi:hypothetical protein
VVKPFSVQVYVEGGGPTRSGDLADECRRGFSTLFEKATGRRIGITACGGRNQAYDAFATAVRTGRHDLAILVVDSEKGGPYDKGRDSFKVLARVDPKKLEACAHAKALFVELKTRLA